MVTEESVQANESRFSVDLVIVNARVWAMPYRYSQNLPERARGA
ncbi:MAG: hypothetical protein ACOH19_07990 [Rhodoglobus sp.]